MRKNKSTTSKSERSTECPRAIPTEYKGVKFKSRLEAQCAVLFDKLEWDWEYEPKSFMLPSGIAFTPDFFIPCRNLFVESRGYQTKKGDKQISGFSEMMVSGVPMTEDEEPSHDFVVLYGDREARTVQGEKHCGMVLLFYCKTCGWHMPSLSSSSAYGMNFFNGYCNSCIAPMDSPTWKRWDGKAIVQRAAIVTVSEGRVLVNGSGLEEFNA